MNKKIIIIAILAAVILINFSFGFPRLSRFSAVDEPYWTYNRVPDFWKAVLSHKWKNTNINDKPGITVAIVSGAGLFYTNPLSYKSFRQEIKTPEILSTMRNINFYLRLPIYLVCLFSLLLFYFLIQKLFGSNIALFSVIFIGLSPIILGISLLINPDAFLWMFATLSILSFFVFQKENKKSYLILSGFLLGLSLLTKYVANILLVYFLAMIFFDYIFSKKGKVDIAIFLREQLVNYFWLVLTSVITFTALYPATWKKPKMILSGTFLSKAFQSTWYIFAAFFLLIIIDNIFLKSKIMGTILDFFSRKKQILVKTFSIIFLAIIIFVLLNTYLGMKFLNFENIIASPKSGTSTSIKLNDLGQNILADSYSLIFGLIPIVFFLLVFALAKTLKQNEKYSQESYIIFSFIFFILAYYTASSINGVTATVRYQIIVYPLASIIAAIGLYQFIQIKSIEKYLPLWSVSIALLAISFYSLYSVKPFYFSYASNLLPSKYVLNLKDMGDGSFEAAQYLNNLPNARELSIWSDKGAVCESFVGKCTISFNKKDIVGQTFDYFVSSTGRKSRSFKMSQAVDSFYDFKKAYQTNDYVYKMEIAGRPSNTIKIVDGKTLIVNQQ